jgi:hypothetical protein
MNCLEEVFSETRPLIYAAACMSIRLALQTAASSSAGDIDLASSDGKKTSRMGVGSLPQQPCPSNAPGFMQGDEFPPNLILGNSEGIKRAGLLDVARP